MPEERERTQDDDPTDQLARRIRAAVVSYYMGVGYDYWMKRYDTPQVQPHWHILAEVAATFVAEGLAEKASHLRGVE